MSFNTEDVNYLIWRYFQETGLPFPAYSLSNEQPSLLSYDEKYKEAVPIGSLVSLIQKGIMYSETERFVKNNGDVMNDEEIKNVLKSEKKKFTIFHALAADKMYNPPTEATGRFAHDDGSTADEEHDVQMKDADEQSNAEGKVSGTTQKKEQEDDDFIFVPQRIFTYEPSTISELNPTASNVLAYGLTGSRAKITVFVPGKPEQATHVTLTHPTTTITATGYSDITTLAWSPLGHLLVTAVESGEVRLWTAEGNLRSVLSLHQRNNQQSNSSIICIKWSPDSKYFLTMDMQNFTVLWDSKTGSVVMNIDNASPTNSNPLLGLDICWITPTKFLLPGPHSTALVYNVSDRAPAGKLIGHTKPITQFQYNTEGELLLTVSDDKTIRIWNGLSFNPCQVLQGHTQEITYASWINKFLVVSTALDGTLRLWDIRDSKKTSSRFTNMANNFNGSKFQIAMRSVDDGTPILMASFSPDRTKIVMATIQGAIIVYRIDINEKGDELKLIDQYDGFSAVEEEEKEEEEEVEEEEEEDDEVSEGDGKDAEDKSGKKQDSDDVISYITSLQWSADSKYVVCGHAKHESIVLRIC
ncbi:hypothetical protein WICPIJ_008371 [Wickerhamomyces pijperi]|uniref:LisH domain-containing protein n=1 Tax=Wickerhamomyces pijperi TaxID=599730 RepID=A0A9P8PXB0_WICPI|nr:hypothetical protein WICPIJ_008371 [Wickerhamomyces pijperi]